MAAWVFSIVDRFGAAGVGLLILLENLIPPIPSEVILPLAGFRAKAGALNVWLVWPAATAGSVTGALVLYGLGRWLGYDRLCRLAGHKWFILASQKDLDRGKRLFRDHGGKIVLLARMVPIIRSIVLVPAGVAGMPIPRFVLLTAIGSGIWNAVFIGHPADSRRVDCGIGRWQHRRRGAPGERHSRGQPAPTTFGRGCWLRGTRVGNHPPWITAN